MLLLRLIHSHGGILIFLSRESPMAVDIYCCAKSQPNVEQQSQLYLLQGESAKEWCYLGWHSQGTTFNLQIFFEKWALKLTVWVVSLEEPKSPTQQSRDHNRTDSEVVAGGFGTMGRTTFTSDEDLLPSTSPLCHRWDHPQGLNWSWAKCIYGGFVFFWNDSHYLPYGHFISLLCWYWLFWNTAHYYRSQ